MTAKINPDNWFWCDICERVSYDFQCECDGSSCNGVGCDKCADIRALVADQFTQGLFPSKKFVQTNNHKRWGTSRTPESQLLETAFGQIM